ncbi:polymeric immunoglobulin receptor-like [Mobula birostris]|uniref:polymeric immunoglobulin receptor-like n=1 Tax=Mobula birostris TaxID=1983395 RepID=UPI003B27FD18
MMWTLILLIGFLPVSGALWAEKHVRGVVGRAITIDCLYEEKYRSHTKYWCHGWTLHCSVLVETNGQHRRSGRVSITDNPEQRIFTVTMEDLHSGDSGWYSCGIETTGVDSRFNLELKVNDELVSVPVLRYLSPANISRLGGSVSLSCESFQGSLPIHYRWYEQTSSGYLTISDTNELTLHCQSFKHTHQQYYCSASNWLGARSSAMVNATVFNNGEICSYVTEINGTISGALWAEDKVRGVVGRAVTIDCHCAPMYRSHTKYLCRMWDHQCTSLVDTNGTTEQYGRMTIRDNTSQGIFTVTMENLVSNDTGHYRCGITTSGNDPAFDVHLQVSDASNVNGKGEKSSEVVSVSISNSVSTCRDVIEVNSIGKKEEDSPATLGSIMETLRKHKKVFSEEFQQKFHHLSTEIKQIDVKLDSIQKTLIEHDKRLQKNEDTLTILDAKIEDLQQLCEKQSKSNEKLRQKIINLENRSRRNNLRILGLEELMEDQLNIPTLSDDNRKQFDLPISYEEIAEAVCSLHSGKVDSSFIKCYLFFF